MKKLILFGCFSLGVLALFAQPSDAGLFRHRGCHGCGRFATTICVQPYNAFSPVCYGDITCLGCSPMHMHGGMPPMMPPMMPHFGGFFPPFDHGMPPACFSSGCCEAPWLPAPGHVTEPVHPPADGTIPPSGGNENGFTPPPPTPLPAISWYNQQRYGPVQPAGYGQVQPAGYYGYPQYYPAYNPWVMPAGYPQNPWYGYQRPYGY